MSSPGRRPPTVRTVTRARTRTVSRWADRHWFTPTPTITPPALTGPRSSWRFPFAANINPPQFTVEAIVNPTAVGTGANDFHAIVFTRAGDTAGNALGFFLCLFNNEFQVRIGTGTPTIRWSPFPAGVVANGGPYYVVVTYDGTTLTLYVNPVDTLDPANPGETAEQQASATVDLLAQYHLWTWSSGPPISPRPGGVLLSGSYPGRRHLRSGA